MVEGSEAEGLEFPNSLHKAILDTISVRPEENSWKFIEMIKKQLSTIVQNL